MGETRRIPITKEEFPRCGEEYIPKVIFEKIGGCVIDFGKRKEIIETARGRVFRLKSPPKAGPLKTLMADLSVNKLLGLMKDKPDIIVSHTFLPITFRKTDIPIILLSHGGYPALINESIFKRVIGTTRKYIEKKAVENANALIAINKYLIGELKSYGIKKPIHLIYSGVDTEKYKPEKNKWKKPLKVVFLSRLHPQKGIWEFIRMAKENKEAEYIIMGYDQLNIANEIRKKIKKHKNIRFLPNVSEEKKRKILSQSHVFVSLSKGYDPTPNVLYEAMGGGMSIASTLKNYRHDVLGDDAFWISEQKDVKSLLGDKKGLMKRAKNMRKKAENKFNINRMISEIKSLSESYI